MSKDPEADMEALMQEFQRLRDAPPGSEEARRRADVDAQIRMLHQRHGDKMSKARPSHEDV